MSRNNFNLRFRNIAQGVLPPGIELLTINGQYLHPVIVPVVVDKDGKQTGGGFQNDKTMFGLTVPMANGSSMYVQVSPKTEELIASNNSQAVEFLQADLRAAVELWDTKAIDHEHALAKIQVL